MRKQFGILILAIMVLFGIYFFGRQADDTSEPNKKTPQPAQFDKQQYSLTDPASIWVVVNKQRPLNPKEYVPGDLRTPAVALRLPADNSSMHMRNAAATALEKMFADATANNLPLRLASAYRSYTYQVGLYAGYVQKEGQVAADAESARPGYSEHQTGLAVDVGNADGVCEVEQCFGEMPAGQWVAAQAYKYGFLLRYPQGKTVVTGYEYEPWHLRYIGVDLATKMHDNGVTTLEEFFELSHASTY
ncbi:MAG TPA: M15 family metallopeptidase [Candidatus Saccharimonadales bacterium]